MKSEEEVMRRGRRGRVRGDARVTYPRGSGPGGRGGDEP